MATSQPNEGSRWNFSHGFLNEFQSSRLDLETQIQQATRSRTTSKEILDSLNVQLAKLSKTVVDATGSLPNYDQRNCETQLKELERSLDTLRKASFPTSKFAFKRKAKETPQLQKEAVVLALDDVAPTSTPVAPTLSSCSGKLILPKDLPDLETVSSELRSELSLIDLDGCVLNLIEAKQYEISALHLRNVKNSILLLPSLEGSIILHDLSNCVIVVRCHQLRMHTSKDIDVYLSIQSNPTIEHCSSIRFGPYPSILPLASGFKQKLDVVVQDFSHIQSTPSPNWTSMPSGYGEDFWQLVTSGGSLDVKQMLAQALPMNSNSINQ